MDLIPNVNDFFVTALFFVGILSGFLDAIVGGGGLISLPAIMFLGVPAHTAIATSKFQGCFGVTKAGYKFLKGGYIDVHYIKYGILFAAIGGISGAIFLQFISNETLKKIIPFALLALLLYKLCFFQSGKTDTPHKMPPSLFVPIFGLLLGFYDGFFGPGVGTFWMKSFVILQGFNILKASAYTKLVNAASNIAATSYFMFFNTPLIITGIIMGIGQIIGASIGVKTAIKNGSGFINIMLVIVVACMCIMLL